MFNWFKRRITKQQKLKMKSVRKTMKEVEKLIEKHLLLNDKKIDQLPDIELIIGCATLSYEETYTKLLKQYLETGIVPDSTLGKIVKENADSKAGMKQEKVISNNVMSVEQAQNEFDKPEFVIAKKVFH